MPIDPINTSNPIIPSKRDEVQTTPSTAHSNAASSISTCAISTANTIFTPFLWVFSKIWLGLQTFINFFFSAKAEEPQSSIHESTSHATIPAMPSPSASRDVLKNYFNQILLPFLEKVENSITYAIATPNGETKMENGLESMMKNTEVISLEQLDISDQNSFIQNFEEAVETQSGSLETYTTKFSVVNADSVDAATEIASQDPRPLVLNMANAFSPGGGVERGAKAQEEAICRRTALYYSISPDHNLKMDLYCNDNDDGRYRIPRDGCIYTPDVPVFYTKKDSGYEPVSGSETIQSLSFVSSAAFNLRTDRRNPHPDAYVDENLTPQEYEEGTRQKIRAQLYTAAKHGHKSIVLSAFGCGAFRNDPSVIAKIYNEELAPVQKYFKNVVFAVLVVNPTQDNKNLYAFKQYFAHDELYWYQRKNREGS